METYSEKMLQALAAENLADAQLNFAKALQSDQNEVLAELGEELIQIGFLEEAREVFDTLQERDPENEEWLLSLAEIAMENDQIDEAFDYLDRITPQSSFYPRALLISADLYQLIGIPEVSEAKLLEAQKLLPKESLIRFALFFNRPLSRSGRVLSRITKGKYPGNHRYFLIGTDRSRIEYGWEI